MLGDFKIGVQINQDGVFGPIRGGKSGETSKADVHSHLHEAAYRGNLFTASNAATADTGTGVAPGTAFGTTMAFVLYNPVGSGVNCDLVRSRMIWLPGAAGDTTVLGSGFIAYGQSPQIVTPTGTAITPVCCQLGNSSTGKAKPFTSGVITTTPTIIRPSSMNLLAVSAAAPTATNGWTWEEMLDGEFLLTPGNVFVMGGIAAAGTTPLVVLGLTWEETPL
jgi:hypothetical protein